MAWQQAGFFCWNEGRGWWQRRMSCTASPQTDRETYEGRGESGRARLEQLLNRAGRHADGCHPHAAAAATKSTVSPVLTSANPPLAAFATPFAGLWRHHDGGRPRCRALDREGDPLRRMSAAHTDPSLATAVAAFSFFDAAEL